MFSRSDRQKQQQPPSPEMTGHGRKLLTGRKMVGEERGRGREGMGAGSQLWRRLPGWPAPQLAGSPTRLKYPSTSGNWWAFYPEKNWKVLFKVPSNLLHGDLVMFVSGISNRETREGWPLLTVETKGEWGLKGYNWKGSFLGWFVALAVPVHEIFVLPWLLSSGPHRASWACSRAGSSDS